VKPLTNVDTRPLVAIDTTKPLVYVADASAFVEIERMVPNTEQSDVFIDLADLIPNEELVFCEQVVTEMERISSRNIAHLFVKQGKSDCFHSGADYNIVRRITKRYTFIDVSDRREVCAPFVLAQAQELIEYGRRVMLVTEDYRKKMPPIISLGAAADDLNIPRLGMLEMLHRTNIWPKL
jgi:hypothetical protein